MGNNEMMLGVDGTLNIVPNHPATSATCGHRASIGVSQGYLLVLGLHHQGVQTVQTLNLLTQRRNLLVGPGEVPIPRVDGLELAAVDRNARFAEQFKTAAQHHELAANPADGLAIVLAEVGYGLEVRH